MYAAAAQPERPVFSLTPPVKFPITIYARTRCVCVCVTRVIYTKKALLSKVKQPMPRQKQKQNEN